MASIIDTEFASVKTLHRYQTSGSRWGLTTTGNANSTQMNEPTRKEFIISQFIQLLNGAIFESDVFLLQQIALKLGKMVRKNLVTTFPKALCSKTLI